jgi:cytidine deaminase
MAEFSTQEDFNDSEVVIGLVGPVGADLAQVTELLMSKLLTYGYGVEPIRISEDVIPLLAAIKEHRNDYERIMNLMDAGDQARADAKDNSILAKGVAALIASKRHDAQPLLRPRTAYVVRSLKHPAEVYRLQQIYPHGFYLIGVNSSADRRKESLVNRKAMSQQQAQALITRDERDEEGDSRSGQHTSDTFHLSDFFINLDEDEASIAASLDRVLRLLFGDPYATPLFDEFAMFMAFAASTRSADLSRQVGSVVARGEEILSVGANDCPKFGGGLYWPNRAPDGSVSDAPNGRDSIRGVDANKEQQSKIIDEICAAASNANVAADTATLRQVLSRSSITDLLEFGRAVHAEMEALLSCARRGVSTIGADLYCTTFPCHNCAKHIVAAGVKRVVYVEPYPKSKAFELHDDAVSARPDVANAVRFEPFVGVSPKRFFDLFSMNLSFGRQLVRKDKATGRTLEWSAKNAKLRVQMLPMSYLRLESIAATEVNELRKKLPGEAKHA